MLKNRHGGKKLTDVETAFLYGNLDRILFILCPEGYNEIRKEMKKHLIYKDNMEGEIHPRNIVLLQKTIYGLVQAARVWWKNLWES